MLPIAVQCLLALLLLLLCGGVAWIAFVQTRTARAKFNLDLYDKRYAIFEVARKYLQRLLNEGIFEEDLRSYDIGVAGAIFLFDNDVNIYLDALRRRSMNLTALTHQMVSLDADSSERDELSNQVDVWLADFKGEHSRLIKAFMPYLKSAPL
jgi:hypothetical protein